MGHDAHFWVNSTNLFYVYNIIILYNENICRSKIGCVSGHELISKNFIHWSFRYEPGFLRRAFCPQSRLIAFGDSRWGPCKWLEVTVVLPHVTLLYSNMYDVKINTLQTKEITLHLNEFGRWLSEKKPLGCYHFLDLAKDCGISSAFHNLALSHRFTVLCLSTQDWQPFNKHASYVNIYDINT